MKLFDSIQNPAPDQLAREAAIPVNPSDPTPPGLQQQAGGTPPVQPPAAPVAAPAAPAAPVATTPPAAPAAPAAPVLEKIKDVKMDAPAEPAKVEEESVFKEPAKTLKAAQEQFIVFRKIEKEAKERIKVESDLKKKIEELEKKPATESNDNKIAELQKKIDESEARRADIDQKANEIERRRVELERREIAVRVHQSPLYEEHVLKPAQTVQSQINMISKSEGGEDAAEMEQAIMQAFSLGTPEERWAATSRIGGAISPMAAARLQQIWENNEIVLKNHARMMQDSDEMKKILEKDEQDRIASKGKVKTEEFTATVSKVSGEFRHHFKAVYEDPANAKLIEEAENYIKNRTGRKISATEAADAISRNANNHVMFQVAARALRVSEESNAALNRELEQLRAYKAEHDAAHSKTESDKLAEEKARRDARPNLNGGGAVTQPGAVANRSGLPGGRTAAAILAG